MDPTPERPEFSEAIYPRKAPRLLAITVRAAGLIAIVAMATYVGIQGRILWVEWRDLERERSSDLQSRVIGYTDVSPNFNFAKPPEDWYHDEGDHAVLWAGWDRRENKHLWFRLERGEIRPDRLSHAIGRDTARPIDYPRTETGGGPVWEIIPEDDLVAAVLIRDRPLAYPFGVLDKVLIINDELPSLPMLVVFAPFEQDESAVDIFDPVLDSGRLLMGHTGYLCDGHPLLYDRGTESLWVVDGLGLSAIAGPLRGAILKRLAHASAISWGTWKAEHPDTRLLVGATRPKSLARR